MLHTTEGRPVKPCLHTATHVPPMSVLLQLEGQLPLAGGGGRLLDRQAARETPHHNPHTATQHG